MLMVMALAIALSACGSSVESRVGMIPASSTAVFSMDIGQMGQKAVNFSDLFASFNSNEEMAEMFEKIDDSGIDFMDQVYMYVNAGGAMDVGGGLIVPLNDADDFMVFLRDMSIEMGSDFTKLSTDGINHAELSNGSVLVLWDDNTALITNKRLVFNEDGDQQLEDALEIFANGASTQLASESDEFQALMDEGHDMSFFLNYESLAPMAMMMNPMMAQSGIKDMKLTYGLDFEDGEMLMDAVAYYDKSAARFMESFGGEVDEDILENISTDSPLGFAAFSLNMEAIYSILDDMGLLEEIEAEMAQEGINFENLMMAFSGDMAFVMNDVEMKRPSWAPETYSATEPDPRFVVSMGLENEDAVEALLEKLVAEGELLQDGNTYMDSEGEAFVQMEDDRILISDFGSRDAIVNGDLGELPGYMGEMLEEYPGAFAMDMENMPESVLQEMQEDLPASAREWFVEEFPVLSIVGYTDFPEDQKAHSLMTIKTRDSGENSLRTILDFVQKLVEAEENRYSRPTSIDAL